MFLNKTAVGAAKPAAGDLGVSQGICSEASKLCGVSQGISLKCASCVLAPSSIAA